MVVSPPRNQLLATALCNTLYFIVYIYIQKRSCSLSNVYQWVCLHKIIFCIKKLIWKSRATQRKATFCFVWLGFLQFIPWVSLIWVFYNLVHGFHWFEIWFDSPKRKQKDLFITLFCPMGYFTSFIKLQSSFLLRSTAELWKNFWWIK